MIETQLIKTADDAQTARVNELLNMLHSSPVSIDKERLNHLLKDDEFNLFVAENEEHTTIGMLTLTCCHTLAGEKAWIEDVIVDERFRGQGAGRALIRAAVRYAEDAGYSVVYLTSNPARTAARSLYCSEGFEEYETGVFRCRTTR